MKHYLRIGIAVALAAVLFLLYAQRWEIRSLRAERDTYRSNTETLLTDARRYAVRDSLSGARVQALELTLAEYKRFRAEDADLIRDLNLRLKDLQAVNKAQTQTIIDLRATPRDTFIIRDSVPIPAISVRCGDAWYTFEGLLAEGEFRGGMVCRDSLLVVESVEYKRFLGFLWRTRRVKSRSLDVISRNPHTTIDDVEFLTIRK